MENINFEEPSQNGFTIYSKSGCHNCLKIKSLLKDKNLVFNIIDCDEYLIEDKTNFLLFVKEKAKQECNFFPMVFNDGVFIGGYNETKEYIDKNILSFDDF
jgi:glutaredoxin